MNNPSSTVSALFLGHEIKPVMRRGSLPFKKRRFLIPCADNKRSSTTTMTALPNVVESDSINSSSSSIKGDGKNPFFMPLSTIGNHADACRLSSPDSDERIAALALVAAAAASEIGAEVVEDHDNHEPNNKNHGFSLFDNDTTTNNNYPATTLTDVLVAAAEELQQTFEAAEESSASTTSSSSSKNSSSNTMVDDNNNNNNKSSTQHQQQQHRQTILTSPLPNGCHGKTSRTNSYCRRSPCYNGSKYCKLHYHHYVVAGGAGASDQEGTKSTTTGEGLGTEDTRKQGKNKRTIDDSTVSQDTNGATAGAPSSAATAGSSTSAHHQDKRFTGCPTETRCEATTTRGRDCSYCAVNDTKYCYLHADYDTNPPPRRVCSSTGAGSTSTTMETSEMSGPTTVQVNGVDIVSRPVSDAPRLSGKKEGEKKRKNSSTSTITRRLSTAKNLEKHMADAPYPLLSTLATENWLNRKVVVSTGPLANHVGVVEKWGNGWVSVRLPGVGLHNRRSFELYLYPGQDDAKGLPSNKTAMPMVEVFDTASMKGKNAAAAAVPKIHRIVSNDNDATTPLIGKKPSLVVDFVHEVTPLASCRVIDVVQKDAKKANESQRVSSILFPTCMDPSAPTHVPESPVPEQEHSESQTGCQEDTPVGSHGTDAEAVREEAKSQDESDRPHKKFRLHLKSLASSKKDNEIPLVESLMLAQEGRVAKNKLGLLFGTAALERSRRHIHKPTRYGDAEMVTTKTKKRGRQSSEKNQTETVAKRRCLGETTAITKAASNMASVISSSDEESPGINNIVSV